MGERYTICDPYLFTLAQWLEADGVDRRKDPEVVRSLEAHGGAGHR
jgi:glutathione S-transferase